MKVQPIPECECGGSWQMEPGTWHDTRKIPAELQEMFRCERCGRILRRVGFADTRAQLMLVSLKPRLVFGDAIATWLAVDVQRALEALAASQAWGSNLAVSNPDPATCRLLVPDHSGIWVEI